ncbi:sugar phosphate isomerase/epimerase family protein [Planctomycetes bacterium K23_9]|uniref:Endonuclease 4 n=1 Tax=Stieleria marina TaxID=1930275 RepID=A0A517NS80_9BACT|nr:endonuclease 4 [Planctomycetes bacterium K23_9]
MNKILTTDRRRFCQMGLAAAGLATTTGLLGQNGFADQPSGDGDKPWLRKTLKIGMIKLKDGSLEDKFRLAKEAGFEGVELNAPTVNVEEANAASKATGLIIDGTVGKYHWQTRHTDPDPAVRKEAMKLLKKGIENTAAVGGRTMLLVPGHGKDGTDQEVYDRAVAAIEEALPLAERNLVSIVIENVWNDFCYDHEGGNDQTADRLAKFVDEFRSIWVGVQFDIGNHWKYGDPAEWIHTLGRRIHKLDIKGFSRAEGKFTKITEGDINWPSVEKALHDIKFTGWLAAEVSGGGLERLKEINDHLEESLHCSKSISSVG